MKIENLIVGCGSHGISTLWKLRSENVFSLEASSRVGGAQFLLSRLQPSHSTDKVFKVQRTLPEIKIWWERNWCQPSAVEWNNKEWAYVLPQWKFFFGEAGSLVDTKLKSEIVEEVKDQVKLEKPVSEIRYEGSAEAGSWHVRSGDKNFEATNLYWTLGIKALQNCLGKKESEEFLEKNSSFEESARDAEGAFVSTYAGAKAEVPEGHFLGLPVRHDGKLYLSFVYIFEDHAETFTFLHNDLLKQPKELSSFEKSLRRTIKHVLPHLLPEPAAPTLGVFSEAKGYTMASPWTLKNSSTKRIYFSVTSGTSSSNSLPEATT